MIRKYTDSQVDDAVASDKAYRVLYADLPPAERLVAMLKMTAAVIEVAKLNPVDIYANMDRMSVGIRADEFDRVFKNGGDEATHPDLPITFTRLPNATITE